MPFKPEENNVSLFETVYLSKGKKKRQQRWYWEIITLVSILDGKSTLLMMLLESNITKHLRIILVFIP